MTSITLLGEAQLRELVPLDLAAIDQVEEAFLALATEAVAMPPVLRLDLPEHNGEVDVKTAWLPRFDSFAIKALVSFFQIGSSLTASTDTHWPTLFTTVIQYFNFLQLVSWTLPICSLTSYWMSRTSFPGPHFTVSLRVMPQPTVSA